MKREHQNRGGEGDVLVSLSLREQRPFAGYRAFSLSPFPLFFKVWIELASLEETRPYCFGRVGMKQGKKCIGQIILRMVCEKS